MELLLSISYLDIVFDDTNLIQGISSILLESIDKKPQSSHWCNMRSPPGNDLDIFLHPQHFWTVEVVSKNVKVRRSHVEKCGRQSTSCRKMPHSFHWCIMRSPPGSYTDILTSPTFLDSPSCVEKCRSPSK